jgi:hypothetical protein
VFVQVAGANVVPDKVACYFVGSGYILTQIKLFLGRLCKKKVYLQKSVANAIGGVMSCLLFKE